MSRLIQSDATDQSTVIRILSTSTQLPDESITFESAGLALWYRRDGETKTAITPATLSALDAAHSDGGVLHIDDGYYRIDLPDAAVADGASEVLIGGTVTGGVVLGNSHPLVGYNPDAVYAGTPPTAAAIRAEIDNSSTQLAAIAANTSLISVGNVTVVSPLSADGQTISLVRGDSYKDAQGRAFAFTSSDWPDLTEATLVFTAKKGSSTITGTVIKSDVGGSSQTIKVELSSTATAAAAVALPANPYRWDVQATIDGETITIIPNGTLLVAEDYS